MKSSMRNEIQNDFRMWLSTTILLAVMVGSIFILPMACGGTTPKPDLSTITVTTDAQLRAAIMKTYGILQAAGGVLDEASKVEAQIAAGAPTPAMAVFDRQFKASADKTAKDAITVIEWIDKTPIKSWEEVKTKVQPVIDDIAALQQLVTPGGHPKLVALLDALTKIAVGILAPQLVGGIR